MFSFNSYLFKTITRGLNLLVGITSTTAIVLAMPFSPDVHAQTEAQSTITVQSDIQEANSETGVFTARGNVQINFPDRQIQATATQAQYFSREQRLVLSGNVYVLQDGNSMQAEKMTYLIDEGRFIAMPESDQQVRSTYIVSEPDETSEPSPMLPNLEP